MAKIVGGQTCAIAVDSTNRLVFESYDAAGRQLTWGSGTGEQISYSWYPLGDLREIETPTGRRAFLYDAGGERIVTLDRQTGDAVFTLRDLSQRVVREVTLHGDGSWSWDADFVYGGGRLLMEDSPKGVRHVHLGLGDNKRLTGVTPVEWAG